MATYKEKRGTNVVPIVSAQPETGVNGEIVYVTGEGLASYNGGTWSKLTAAVVPLDWTATTQQAKIQASDIQASDNFAVKVAIDGDTIVAGANNEDTGAQDTGSAYVFTRSGTTWSQQAKITASDGAVNDLFGIRARIAGDTIIIGALQHNSNAGAAYVFTRSGTSWSQQAKLVASDAENGDMFGSSIDMTGDTIIVGAPEEDTGASGAGAAYIFTRSGTTWTEAKKIQASDAASNDYFGDFVGISGNTVLVSAYGEDTGGDNAGAAYTFVAG